MELHLTVHGTLPDRIGPHFTYHGARCLFRANVIVSTLSGEDILLVRVRLTCIEVRSLENDDSVAENEIVDVAFSVELPE
ncbi:hypothetical protein L6452_02303 [Arctium lappa]|uniref:Uncharacterized protein n=1 Tax=Arctium lappa TaxID=4217 RepID=A0ACB9FK08_ARCLA|nr:hypothetical protein L6452_02303 [Arctium lappa]